MSTDPLLDRARLVVAGGEGGGAGLLLDGWPLMWVDVAGGTVAVNDLRQRAMYGHRTPVGPIAPPTRNCASVQRVTSCTCSSATRPRCS